MIELIGGDLYQWDTGRKLLLTLDEQNVKEVHITVNGMRTAYVLIPEAKDDYFFVSIPNKLLTQYDNLLCYEVIENDKGEQSISKTVLKIHKRNRPADYVYTEAEVLSYSQLDKRIKRLEDNPVDDTKLSQSINDYMIKNPIKETDPTVSDWAKQPNPPTYTAEDVGADASGTADSLVKAHNESDTAHPAISQEIAKLAAEVGNKEASGTAESKVSEHNTATDAHNDIRLLVQGLTERLNALADSDDETLDQMSEIVSYIKSNKTLIDAITTSKISVSDIIDNLTTNVSNKPLSAAQGVVLKGLIDELRALIPEAYTLPMATETVMGGVKPVTATDAMTQPVGVTEDGRLVTKPGEGGSGISVIGATVGQTIKIAAVDDNGVPTAWEPVDLPSGVGSYKHIETITIPDDEEIAIITFTIPAKTRKLYVLGRTNTTSTFDITVRANVRNGNTNLAFINLNLAMNHRSALFAAELNDDIQFMIFSSSNSDFAAAYPGNVSFYDYASYFYAENNTFNIIIRSASSNQYFAPGCTFALYALCEE